MLARAAALAPADFFAGVRKGLKARLPADLRNFEITRGHSRLLKIHYGRPELHFEAWHHTGDGRLEVGLHFEGPPQLNRHAFDFFREHMVEVKAALRRAELEPWDRGWSRLYETLPAPVLDEHVMASAIDLMHDYITALQPMVARFVEEEAA
ncbi:MAG TPA: hypothetical protein VFL29_12905 [Candidatus Dormibacteraeota bacterium]|nr:hypothetical protein [Candidatus Dormibacteraeota bacterium]